MPYRNSMIERPPFLLRDLVHEVRRVEVLIHGADKKR
jgi:hypothetical protein